MSSVTLCVEYLISRLHNNSLKYIMSLFCNACITLEYNKDRFSDAH